MSRVAAAVTGDAALALRQNGQFELGRAREAGSPAEVTADRATAIAITHTRTFSPMIASHLEEQRGGRIEFQQVRACGRALYAESPYEEIPLSTPRIVRITLGPQWLISLCDDAGPALLIAVAAYATDLGIEDGQLVFPRPEAGGEVVPAGIPKGRPAELLSPEEVAVFVAEKMQRRVTSVPRLVAPGLMRLPQTAAWQVILEGEVPIRVAGELRSGSVFYRQLPLNSSYPTQALIAADSQPEFVDVRLPPPPPAPGIRHLPGSWRQIGDPGSVRVRRRADVPLRFVEVP